MFYLQYRGFEYHYISNHHQRLLLLRKRELKSFSMPLSIALWLLFRVLQIALKCLNSGSAGRNGFKKKKKKKGFIPCKAEQPLWGMGLQEKEAQKY